MLILLAGGKSKRMGFPKGLLDYKGKFWILEQISRYKNVIKPKVYIGLGYDYEIYFNKIPWLAKAVNDFILYDCVEVMVIVNQHPQLGSFSTLQAVLNKIENHSTVIILPIDVPLLKVKDLNSIINEDNYIVIPKCDDINGHPVKLEPDFWQTLLTIKLTSKKARLDLQIKNFNSSSVTYLNVSDISVYQNINLQSDWEYFKSNNT